MQKKFLLLIIFVGLACFTAGGLLFHNPAPQEKQSDGGNSQNTTPGAKSGDLEQQAACPQAMTSKDGEKAPAAPRGDARAGGEKGVPSSPAPQSSDGSGGSKARPAQEAKSYSPQQQPSPAPAQAPDTAPAGPLRSRIEQAYISRLQSLASGYEGKLNGLVSAALDECSAARKANPNADLSPLINKYYAAAKALEAECDSQFYSMLASFESDLKAHSFPLDMVATARGTYEARKSARAAQITTGRP